jgi:hypothetical protein
MNQDTLDLQSIYSQTQAVLGQGAAFGAQSLSESDLTGGMPPWIIPPAGADPFDATAVVNVGLVGVDATILTLLVPYGYDGVIKRFYHNYLGAGYMEGSGDLVWRILADGRPIKNFGNILTQMGSPTTPRVTDGIRIFTGQSITYVVSHPANVILTDACTASLAGYYYPRTGS